MSAGVFWAADTVELSAMVIGQNRRHRLPGVTGKRRNAIPLTGSPHVDAVLLEDLVTEKPKSRFELVVELIKATASGRTAYAELLRLRLMEEVPGGEIETLNRKDGRNYGYAVRVTELGRRVRSFLRSVVAEFVQELARSAPDEK